MAEKTNCGGCRSFRRRYEGNEITLWCALSGCQTDQYGGCDRWETPPAQKATVRDLSKAPDDVPFSVPGWDDLIAMEEELVEDLTDRLAKAQRIIVILKEQRDLEANNYA